MKPHLNIFLRWLQYQPRALLFVYALAWFILFTSAYNVILGLQIYINNPQFVLPPNTIDPFYELGTSLGFWGTIYLCLNFILATRWRWVERLFNGLDKVYHAHAWIGKISLTMILLHLAILVIHALPQPEKTAAYLIPGINLSYTLGQLSVVLLVVLVLLTLWVQINYQTWLKTHQVLGIPYILGGLHAIVAQGDWYMILLTILGGWAWLYSLLFYRRVAHQAHATIQHVLVKGTVTEITFRLKSTVQAYAGQFIFFSVAKSAASIPSELHPFSISKIIDSQTWRISAKNLGDYTATLSQLKKGDDIVIYGPHGTFGRSFSQPFPRQIWVAGGIGITPFLSLLHAKSQQPDSMPCHLIWAVRQQEDAIYRSEIEQLIQQIPQATFYIHTGRLSANILENLLGESVIKESAILLCGPAAMMFSLRSQLTKKGKPEQHFFYEDFSFRP